MFENAVNIQGHTQQTLTAGTATTAPLLPGVYDVWGTADAYIKVNKDKTVAAAVTSGTGYKIAAGNIIPIVITDTGSYLGTSADISFHKVK